MNYTPSPTRYDRPDWFRRCGESGLLLPAISLGCWYNFGAPGTDSGRHTDETSMHENCRRMLCTAFDLGVTHFDLANNYGPPPGSAEERVGRILRQELAAYRDELIISTKAGYRMWPGPYGEWGSRKYLLASLDASLKRLQLEYVDLFYSHRPDPNTPLEETLFALDTAVRSGKALYVGISSYSGAQTADVVRNCQANGWVRPIIHQPSYSMLNRWVEPDLLPITGRFGLGTIAFCPLAQGLLTGKYLDRKPDFARFDPETVDQRMTGDVQRRLRQLNEIAQRRGQSLAQMALLWVLREQRGTRITSALIGASRPEQIIENCKLFDAGPLSEQDLKDIESALTM